MSATKALTTNLELQTTITNAAVAAIKAGLTKDEVAAIIAAIADLVTNSDD